MINDSDSLATLFRPPEQRPPGVQAVNLRVLSPFQRALLVIDGTVTKFIEAYTMEPLDIELLSQAEEELSVDDGWLGAPAGTRVSRREVLIRGRYSRRSYVYAVSLVVPERLPESIRVRLDLPGEGIGRLLNEMALETRREILWFGRSRGAERLPPSAGQAATEFVSRAYRIIAGGQPIALIHEHFPCPSTDSLPATEA